jgi:hypothetical protein
VLFGIFVVFSSHKLSTDANNLYHG